MSPTSVSFCSSHLTVLLVPSYASQDAEIAREAAERRKREDEEARKWMGMISVEGEGTGMHAAVQGSSIA